MYCRSCGTLNDDNAYKCVRCGEVLHEYAPGAAAPTQPVPNYLAQSILVTLFCCLPFGIPAIVYAAQVNGKLIAGDMQGAVAASNSARMWCWVSFWTGLGVVALYFMVIVFAAVQ